MFEQKHSENNIAEMEEKPKSINSKRKAHRRL